MHFRLYQPDDFNQLYAIEEACFLPPLRFSRSYMRQLVKSTNAATWVAEEDGVLAGFAIIEWLADATESIAYIETIEISEARRKQGIGTELLLRIEASARSAGAQSVWLHVDAENDSAIRLYEAQGYEYQGREKLFYDGRRDALIYSKSLSVVITTSPLV